ncbi:hypothetical protein, partial [Xanthomonas fragariae]|uniref:hypothetical protein n=1 Tax=Xanthomonas fragariae TaxID=48664 RepID=UPI001F28E187
CVRLSTRPPRHGIVRLNQSKQLRPRHHLLHLGQEDLTAGLFALAWLTSQSLDVGDMAADICRDNSKDEAITW